uniref:Uncharacterized protein n=1 Tax=Oryza glumipatula TaxID=40148 RepID=A0A0D9YYY4_9ORYZ
MECQQTGKGKARRNQLKIHLPPSVNFCFGEEMKKEAQREHHGSNSVLIVLSELGRTEPDDEGGGAEEEEGGDDDADFLVAVKSGHVGSNMNPDGELRKLKDRFATWKKYKCRLKETKFLNSGWIITASYNLCNHWYIERWRVVVYNGGFGVQEPDAN